MINKILRNLLFCENNKYNINLLNTLCYKQTNKLKKIKLNHNLLLKYKLISTSSNNFNKFKMSLEKPNVIFVLGGPGAGKGTQCQKIVDQFGFIHLSAGDLLREERAREGSEYGQLIENYIKDGKIVPVEITCSLLENAMNKNIQELGRNKFLIDGFPRNQDNLDGWERKMANKVNLLFVLFFDCPEDTCIERCIGRGQSGSGRSDDNLESLKKRIVTYQNDSLPIIEYFKKINLIRRIDASQMPNEVFTEVQAAFKEVDLISGGGDNVSN